MHTMDSLKTIATNSTIPHIANKKATKTKSYLKDFRVRNKREGHTAKNLSLKNSSGRLFNATESLTFSNLSAATVR